jgi:hypothetical protein
MSQQILNQYQHAMAMDPTSGKPMPKSEVTLAGSKAVKAIVINPSDTVDIPFTSGLYVGTSGDIRMTMSDGSIVTRKNVAGGVTHPWSVKRVWVTGTTATDLIGDY